MFFRRRQIFFHITQNHTFAERILRRKTRRAAENIGIFANRIERHQRAHTRTHYKCIFTVGFRAVIFINKRLQLCNEKFQIFVRFRAFQSNSFTFSFNIISDIKRSLRHKFDSTARRVPDSDHDCRFDLVFFDQFFKCFVNAPFDFALRDLRIKQILSVVHINHRIFFVFSFVIVRRQPNVNISRICYFG